MHTRGIHHVTGITGDPQKNIDFYTGVLGLRLVKLTVNFDDPSAYHLYYGNANGQPGTAMTFFAWPRVREGQTGVGEITTVAYSIPRHSIPFWKDRLAAHKVAAGLEERFVEKLLRFNDPDGLELELVAEKPLAEVAPWDKTVPAEHAIRAFHAVTLTEDGSESTRGFLTETFGFTEVDVQDTTFRYKTSGDEAGRYLYVRAAPDLQRGIMGSGTVHHVAFRAADDADELRIRDEMLQAGRDATPVIDRQYFHSVYFREPGGILFEIATNNPGFTVDESLEELGSGLRLPPRYDIHRDEIVRALPPLKLPRYE